MRLMLLCCTWKDEHMGEDEGEEVRKERSVGLLRGEPLRAAWREVESVTSSAARNAEDAPGVNKEP